MARLDPSERWAAAARTSCEITGSRASSGGDPAVRHCAGCVGQLNAPVAARGLFVGRWCGDSVAAPVSRQTARVRGQGDQRPG
eukprot:COSAG06_NODE_360_length_16832_cov_9.250209_7_plen_83_part_00